MADKTNPAPAIGGVSGLYQNEGGESTAPVQSANDSSEGNDGSADSAHVANRMGFDDNSGAGVLT